jgi:cell division septation protein DedD
MRFEIGPGGVVVILLGLLGLSGAVFGLGLIAGHELLGPEPGAQPVASAYPLPAAPESGSSSASTSASKPASAAVSSVDESAGSTAEWSGGAEGMTASTKSEGESASPAQKPASKPAIASAHLPKAPPSSPAAGSVARKTASSKTLAAKGSRASEAAASSPEDLSAGVGVAPPPPRSASAAASDNNVDEDEEEDVTAAPPPPRPAARKKVALVNPPSTNPAASIPGHPYSIQIDAVMDRQGAQQMAQKLRAKGFQPFIVPTQLAGKTWYRLRVGHYASAEEAQAAEAKLHQEFNGTPASH